MIDSYEQCRDSQFSRITMCMEYGKKDCNRKCWYARQREHGALEHDLTEVKLRENRVLGWQI